MKNYKVKLTFKYSDTVYVKATTEKEAIEQALQDCEEQYESFLDASVSYKGLSHRSLDDGKMDNEK